MVQLIVSWYDATDQTQSTKRRQKSRTNQPLPIGIAPRHRLLVPTCHTSRMTLYTCICFQTESSRFGEGNRQTKAAAQHHVDGNQIRKWKKEESRGKSPRQRSLP
jgi:hypothetical protein